MTTAPRDRAGAAPSAGELYGEGLEEAHGGSGGAGRTASDGGGSDGGGGYRLRDVDGHLLPFDLDRFVGALAPGDAGLLDRCAGPTLDVGCGPGRLVAALGRRGVPVLGIDVTASAVRLARRRAGASVVLQRSVFDRVPGQGRWSRVLLVDGNVGIGGDPTVLLARVAALLGPAGTALVETAPSGTGLRRRTVRVEAPDGRCSAWFPWAEADAESLTGPAGEVALEPGEVWSEAGRTFCALHRAD